MIKHVVIDSDLSAELSVDVLIALAAIVERKDYDKIQSLLYDNGIVFNRVENKNKVIFTFMSGVPKSSDYDRW